MIAQLYDLEQIGIELPAGILYAYALVALT
jgi:hypothetical protein